MFIEAFFLISFVAAGSKVSFELQGKESGESTKVAVVFHIRIKC